MNEVTPTRPATLTSPDLTKTVGLALPEALPFANGSSDRPSGFLTDGIALPGKNVIAMLDATLVVDRPRFGLYDGNYAEASMALASFWPSATGVNSQVGHLSVLPIPEPSTAFLFAAGLVGLGMRRRQQPR